MKTFRVLLAMALLLVFGVAAAGTGPLGPYGGYGPYGWGGPYGVTDELDPADGTQQVEPTDEVTPRGPDMIDPGQGNKVRNGR